MTQVLQIAAALERVSEVESGQSVSFMHLMKLLYYAQAITLAQTGAPLFDGAFQAWTHGPVEMSLWKLRADHKADWLRMLATQVPQMSDAAWEHLRGVYHVFGSLNGTALSQATHVERPWVRARKDLRWDQPSQEPISETAMRDFYAEIIDDGEDALRELGLPLEEGLPAWALAYRVGVNLKRLVGHPFFDGARSREWRSALGLADVPDRWSEDDFRPLERSARDLRGMAS